MKKKAALFSFLVIVLSASFLSRTLQAPTYTTYKDFEKLDGEGTHFWKKMSADDQQELLFYKNLYLRHWPAVMNPPSETKIPKVIHYIWLGPKSFPEKSIPYIHSWMKNHPGWVVKFWTDDEDRDIPCPGMEKHLVSDLSLPFMEEYLEQTDNYGEKSDLLRYEILMQEGGIYVDHDIECYHSFEPLSKAVDFFTGLEAPHHNPGIALKIFPCNALIGSKPLHPILRTSLELVQKRWDEVEQAFPGTDAISRTLKVMHRSFHSFSLATRQEIDKEGNKDIVLPASFFYADPIVKEKVFESWKSKGLIWASHKCSGEWRPVNNEAAIYESLEKEKTENRLLKKKLRQTKALLYGNFALTGLCLFLALRNKQKIRALRG